MTRARYQQVSLQDTPYYHCISRCVRRAYLCGDDPVSGKNFDHRKQWLVTHIKQLAAHFSMEICAYAVMSNHYHLVLYVNQAQAEAWTDNEVIERWTAVFPRNGALIETLLKNKTTRAAQRQLQKNVSLWRQRLMDISWFMRCLNETLARAANREDECRGRFWEGRFKSQALLDNRALLACMAYVDLNPIRAAIAKTPEQSDYTSIQERIEHPDNHCLTSFSGLNNDGLPCNLEDYLELVDWAGREVKCNKRGYIPANAPPILARLRMDTKPILDYLSKDEITSFGALGPVSMLKAFAKSVGRRFIKGHAFGARLCPERVL